jgi:hypothetical protein
MTIGLIVIVNYDDKQICETFVQDNLDMLRDKLVDFLFKEFNKRTIDFPIDYYDFASVWFQNENLKDVFTYKVLNNSDWVEPWSYNEIYQDAIDALITYEVTNNPVPDNEYSEDYDIDELDQLKVIAKNQEEQFLEL